MSKIAAIDLPFHWPPSGGASVDLASVLAALQRRGHEVKLFAPDFREFVPRGRITGELGFAWETIPFDRHTFNYRQAPRAFRKAVDAFGPDSVLIGDGYFLKAWLADAFADVYPTAVRMYAYEVMCPQNNHFPRQSHGGEVTPAAFCDTTFFDDRERCLDCFMPQDRLAFCRSEWRSDAPTRPDQLHWFQEWVHSIGFAPAYRDAVRRMLNKAAGVIVYNEDTAAVYRRFTDRVRVISGGVDVSRFAVRDHGPRERPAVLATGRLDDRLKGLHVLLEALDTLHAAGRRFTLRTTHASQAAPVRPWVENLGWRPWEEMPATLAQADIFAVPSIWPEPFGLTAVEAMAAGLPVAASAVGGLRTSVQDGVTGRLVPPADPAALAEALDPLLADHELRASMGAAGRKRAGEVFDWDHVAAHYEPLLAV